MLENFDLANTGRLIGVNTLSVRLLESWWRSIEGSTSCLKFSFVMKAIEGMFLRLTNGKAPFIKWSSISSFNSSSSFISYITGLKWGPWRRMDSLVSSSFMWWMIPSISSTGGNSKANGSNTYSSKLTLDLSKESEISMSP